MPVGCELRVLREQFPIRGVFRISRGARTVADVVRVELEADGAIGQGECVPYSRYGESMDSVVRALESMREALRRGLGRDALQHALPPGAARNALDCALWHLQSRRCGRPVHQLAGLPAPAPVTTAYTLSLDSAQAMGEAARANSHRPLLKIKLGGDGDLERITAVREGAPLARLIVDANEGWTAAQLPVVLPAMALAGVAMIEQPLPAAADAALAGMERTVLLCADESCHTAADLDRLVGRYDIVNIKLDKTGGLTAAMALAVAARERGLGLMIGCMIGSSLAMAPALLLAGGADFVDLDGPLLLATDRVPALRYEGSTVHPAPAGLWG